MKEVKSIVDYCKDREYVKANKHYLQLSIGKKAWPIGVTSVGIHMRTGREKIQINKTTHVMNNEQQVCLYLQFFFSNFFLKYDFVFFS